MKTTAPRNCIIGIKFRSNDIGLFHVDSNGDIACALNRNEKGRLQGNRTSWGATMFADHWHNHWAENLSASGAAIVNSHCIDPCKLNSGDLRRLAKKADKLSKKHELLKQVGQITV